MTNFPSAPNYSGHVLVASPSPAIRERLLSRLNAPDWCVEQASGGAEALGRLESGVWQTLFLDRHLPDLDPDELTRTIRQRFPSLEVVVLDDERGAEAESGDEGSSIIAGDCDTLVCDSQPENLNSRVHEPLPGMIGSSRAMISVYRTARLVARRDTTVLISGPTGSGKELVARAIHDLSARATRPFVVVNCAAIPEALLESELFGHVRGAFTGAMQSYGGRIQSAQGGTLLLDEIGDMPLSLQPKLLRFLEQKEVQRLGSCDSVRVDTRVIAATNIYLAGLVASGKFREDLFYRLNAFPIEIPPLRQRTEDIVALVRHVLEKLVAGPFVPKLSREAIQLLKLHSWPGNVRELQNTIERAVILAEGSPTLRPEHLLLRKSGYRN
jgi:DNA-binding NtrC family response regulator